MLFSVKSIKGQKSMKKEIKLYSTLFILALSALILSGCGAEKNMKKGEKYLAVGEYYDAATQFKRAYQRTAPKESLSCKNSFLKIVLIYV